VEIPFLRRLRQNPKSRFMGGRAEEVSHASSVPGVQLIDHASSV